MVTNALEEMALSYHRNTEEQNEICDKHKIPLIKIIRTMMFSVAYANRNGFMQRIK